MPCASPSLLSSSIVLIVLLYEITALYGGLLGAVLRQRREREARLMTGDAVAASIAHEVRQPLTAMVTTADAGLRFLDRSTPNSTRPRRHSGNRLPTAIAREQWSQTFAPTSRPTSGTGLRSTSTSSSGSPCARSTANCRSTVYSSRPSRTEQLPEISGKPGPASAGASQPDHERHRRDGGERRAEDPEVRSEVGTTA